MQKLKFKIEGMHCTACAMDIDGELEDTEGIAESKTNYAKAHTEVSFDSEKITEEKIRSIINKIGYKTIPLEN